MIILNSLIHLCRDGHDGYMKAADGITSSAYKTMFAEYAHQRSRFASQLSNMVVNYGGEPDDDGHAMKMFSRGWKGIEPAVMGGDNGAIFAECEDSEAKTRNAYESVLEKTIPKDAAIVINQQYEQIVEAHARLQNLLEAYHLEHKN
ncbi:MAG: PA2169 family four-helix-bundle protein [Chloroflexota bacterium]